MRKAAKLGGTDHILLFQGGFAKDRGLETLVACMDHAPPTWHLVLLGNGAEESNLRKLAGDRVHFLPPVDWDVLHLWSAGADLGAILYEPTCTNQKLCSPNKLWEYPSGGVPILASDLPFLGKMVTDHGLGLTIPTPTLPDDVYAALNSLSAARIESMKAACASFTEGHAWEQEVVQLELLIECTFASR